jgi:uncharacterized protein
MKRLLVIATLVLFSSQATAEGWVKGVKAYINGDYATALKELLPIGKESETFVQVNLGRMYENGLGVETDYSEAAKWYRLAAERGDIEGQKLLGLVYFYRDVENFPWASAASVTELTKWLTLAAEQGDKQAQHHLGDRYGSSYYYFKTEFEPEKAVKWYRLAAEQGYAGSQEALGVYYKNGKGVIKNYAKAVKWFRLAAVQGDIWGPQQLAIMYEEGKGVLKDNVMAHMWYNIASVNGVSSTGIYRDELESKMTAADISKATNMARECMNSNYEKCGY